MSVPRRKRLPLLNRENGVVAIAAAAALLVMGAVSERAVPKPVAVEPVISSEPVVLDPQVVAEDRRLEKLLIGQWKADYHGVLTVENREDGTASMRLDFDFLASLLYGRRLDLKLTWKVENNILTYLIHSGSPEENWKPFNKQFGDKVAYNFRKIGADLMQLARTDTPEEVVDWVKAHAPSSPKVSD